MTLGFFIERIRIYVQIMYTMYANRIVGRWLLLALLLLVPDLGQAQTDSVELKGQALKEVVISAKSKERKLHESGLPVSIISVRQLQGTASSIDDVLARTAGITIRQTGGVGSSSRLSVRGLEGKRVGVYIDEQPIGELSDMVSLNDVPIDMIDHIEVYKGIVPNKLGGNSMGGAVNIVVKEYPPFYLDGSYEVGSFHTHRLSTVLKRHDRGTGLTYGVGGGFTYSANDYEMSLPQRQNLVVRREHDHFRKILAGGSITADERWGLERAKLEFYLANTYRELQGIVTPIDSAYNHNLSIGTTLLLKRRHFLLPGLDLDNELSGVYSYGGLRDRATSRRDWDGTPLPPTSPYGGELQNLPSDGHNRSYYIADKLYMTYTLSGKQALSLSARLAATVSRPRDDYQRERMHYEASRPGDVLSLTLGLGHEIYAFDDRFLSSLTGKWYYYKTRGEQPSYFGSSTFVPVSSTKGDFGISEALRYQLLRPLMVKGSVAWELRLPSSEELLGNGYLILPSTALSPERSLSANLGLLFQSSYSYGRTEVEINGFYNDVRDMTRLVSAMGPALQYTNFGQMRSLGIEAEVKSDVTPWFYLYANATYQDLRDTRTLEPRSTRPNPTYGKRMPNIPYLLGNAGLELHWMDLFGFVRGANTRLLCDASYVHEYFYDFEVSRFQERRIPSSISLDAGLEQSFGNGRWTVTAKVKNLLDRDLYSEYNQPLPGRSFSLKLRYLLK